MGPAALRALAAAGETAALAEADARIAGVMTGGPKLRRAARVATKRSRSRNREGRQLACPSGAEFEAREMPMDDVEEIKKLKARYFRALDSKDWQTYGDIFAEDCVVDLTRCGGPRIEGRENFRAYGSGLTIVQSVHHGHNPEIELTGPDSATGVWCLEDYNIWEDGRQNHGWGHYLEVYVKRDGAWFIRNMALSYLRIETDCRQPAFVAGKDNTAHLRGPDPAGTNWK